VRGGAGTNPLLAGLARQTGVPPEGNFHEYLVGRDGRRVTSFTSAQDPLDPRLTGRIEDAAFSTLREKVVPFSQILTHWYFHEETLPCNDIGTSRQASSLIRTRRPAVIGRQAFGVEGFSVAQTPDSSGCNPGVALFLLPPPLVHLGALRDSSYSRPGRPPRPC
jgi:hypothetical protein